MTDDRNLRWLIVSARSDWPETHDGDSGDLARKVVTSSSRVKARFGTPKVLLVEDDVDLTNVEEVVWAFATRAHPEHGEAQFAAEPFVDLGVYLDDDEHHTYKASKVVHNCVLADRFPNGERPIKDNLEHGWPPEIQDRVLCGRSTGSSHSNGAHDLRRRWPPTRPPGDRAPGVARYAFKRRNHHRIDDHPRVL